MRQDVTEVFEKYKRNVFSAALSITKNRSDAEDVLQDTFIAYMKDDTQFESEEHLKAWLLRSALNRAKNCVNTFWNRNKTSFEEFMQDIQFQNEDVRSLFEAVMSLKPKISAVIHLYYYEGYSVKEISSLLSIPEGTVASRMNKGRKELKKKLEEWYECERKVQERI